MNTKVFNDAVHGSIELHPLCVKFIDTPQFQRLRFVKQLGIACFVYHSAGHNRFEHCLGVCYLAGEFARTLQRHQPELDINDKDVLCVEIAGLCHDLGHGPFSHLWESFIAKMRPEADWKHEETSVAMFKHLISVNGLEKEIHKYGLDKTDIRFIVELIAPHRDESTGWPFKGRPKEKGFLYQIVANDKNGVDVDKWDYFLRDSHSLGLKVTFDYNRLMKFSRVIDISKTDEPNLLICYRDKEETNLYDMFHTRMLLHKKAYQHRVTKTLDVMLLDALTLANDHITYKGENGKDLVLCDVVKDLSAMTYLHDDVFHSIYRNSSPHEDMKKAKGIIHNILTRRYYPYVGHALVPNVSGLKTDHVLNKLIQFLPLHSRLNADDLDVQLININYGNKDKNPILNVGFFFKDFPNICKFRSEGEDFTFTMHPKQFEENILRVVCRKYDQDIIEDARYAFSETCLRLGIRNLHGAPWNNSTQNGFKKPREGMVDTEFLNF